MPFESLTTIGPSYHADRVLNDPSIPGTRPLEPSLVRLVRYRFHTHFHPYVTELVRRLVAGSVRGLQDADTESPELFEELFSEQRYDPGRLVVGDDLPVKDLDFSFSGAYSVYNWELFYHVPITLAIHLTRNQRFAEAQRWLHYIFDPTDDSDGPAPERYWKVRPLHEGEPTLVEKLLANLSTGDDRQLQQQTIASIARWEDTPFQPHAVARYRHTAYMFKAVMAYLDNLIAWGDSLFREDTRESVNEATQLYVLAANLLGPRPQEVPQRGRQQPQTYASLRSELDEFGNAMRGVEADLPFDAVPEPEGSPDGAPTTAVRSIGESLYFCVPRNEKLVGYWDTVADRLFKIRNSLDIHGVFRRLPLFDPPLDPALLAKAAAAGVDVGAVATGLGQPLPLVRFAVLIAEATELCQEVKSLGTQLLAAIEKQDAEQLAILRSRHEQAMLELAESVRYGQWQEAIKAREAVEQSFRNAVARYTYYERLLGRPADQIEVPWLDALDTGELERLRLSPREPELSPRPIDVDIIDAAGVKISPYEAIELGLLSAAQAAQLAATGTDALTVPLAGIPDIEAAAKPMGSGAGVTFGGTLLVAASQAGASGSRDLAGALSFGAGQVARVGSYRRREQEWAFQSNVATGDITQIYKQWRAAQIREALAEREWRNHEQQIRHAEEIEQFLTDPSRGKTSNAELYSWLRREARGLYGQCYELAYDVAKQAERALQHELGDPDQHHLRYDHRSGNEGLLAGERLYLDLKRMELAYQEQNRREHELTTHVSLRQLDPVALLRLRATGSCEFDLPEELFDLECPGHYFRRLTTVEVSIPCVVGPYTSVHAMLTQLGSSVRTGPDPRPDGAGYPPGEDDDRFSEYLGAVRSVVTSSGNQDSGMFEVNLRDERYLPFEGSGAVSSWRLELPADLPQFDHDTISDVVLHLRYTARDGGDQLRAAAQAHVRDRVTAAATAGSVRLLSLRHEFPTEWARFTAAEPDPRASLTITLRQEHYPFWARALEQLALHRMELFAEPGTDPLSSVGVEVTTEASPAQLRLDLTEAGMGKVLHDAVPDEEPLPSPLGELTLQLDDNSMRDLWLGLMWGGEPPDSG